MTSGRVVFFRLGIACHKPSTLFRYSLWSSPGWRRPRGTLTALSSKEFFTGTIRVSCLYSLRLYQWGNLKVLEFLYILVVLDKLDKWNSSLICFMFASLLLGSAVQVQMIKFAVLLSQGPRCCLWNLFCCKPQTQEHKDSYLWSSSPSCCTWKMSFIIHFLGYLVHIFTSAATLKNIAFPLLANIHNVTEYLVILPLLL